MKNDLIKRLEAIVAELGTSDSPAQAALRPAMAPFDVELDDAHMTSVAKEIDALNKALADGSRGFFDVPTGHANAIKHNFENAVGKDGRRWRVEIVSVNPTFAKVVFHADGDPQITVKQ